MIALTTSALAHVGTLTPLLAQPKKPDWDTINRCGVGVWSTGPEDPFADLCGIHDHAYLRGGTLEEMLAADAAFIHGMWERVKDDASLFLRATAYTAIVTQFGRYWWRSYDRLAGESPPPALTPEMIGESD